MTILTLLDMMRTVSLSLFLHFVLSEAMTANSTEDVSLSAEVKNGTQGAIMKYAIPDHPGALNIALACLFVLTITAIYLLVAKGRLSKIAKKLCCCCCGSSQTYDMK
ncbi:hypothetical protein QR680_006163 [Steinernema hermaphroditum]|uniref:Uncharacterized protein n=1 Tax=Steinernema hermaphroditum TaxID=289476 RepID=A0AA39LWN7_9BILA|nr:hypothetical protein QR680_006163 [Steinernema hermaphroditum]